MPTPELDSTWISQADVLLGKQAGSFKLVRVLGRGGMATVYLGEHALIGSRVAVKVLHPHIARDPTLVARFFDEARAVNVIGHHHIVRVFDMSAMPTGEWYLVMEYLDGEPLSARKVPLDPGAAVDILVQLCDALGAAHRHGIVHRDIKPENIFLVPGPNGREQVKVLDFGIARIFGSRRSEETAAGVVLGTPAFMAPEQWTSASVDARADLYSAALVGIVLLTGSNPLESVSLHEVLSGAAFARLEAVESPPGAAAVLAVLRRALSPRPEDRYASAAELREALERSRTAPQRRPSSGASRIRARVTVTGRSFEAECSDLSRAGVYVHHEGPLPATWSAIELTLQLPGGAVPCRGEVVRQVASEQARAWGMAAGFAVQFRDTSPRFAERLEAAMRGDRVTGDREAEARVAALAAKLGAGPYEVLGVSLDASCSAIRLRMRALLTELDRLELRPLSPTSSATCLRIREAIKQAGGKLGEPRQRAEYDARQGNVAGVAQCIAAGLTLSALEALREELARDRPSRRAHASVLRITGDVHLASGDPESAIASYEEALRCDPLDVELHRKLSDVRRMQRTGSSYGAMARTGARR